MPGNQSSVTMRAIERKAQSEQIHLRMAASEAEYLRALAEERDQTISATVRFLLRFYKAHCAD